MEKVYLCLDELLCKILFYICTYGISHVTVHWANIKETPQTEWLPPQNIYFSQLWEAGKSKIKVPQHTCCLK